MRDSKANVSPNSSSAYRCVPRLAAVALGIGLVMTVGVARAGRRR